MSERARTHENVNLSGVGACARGGVGAWGVAIGFFGWPKMSLNNVKVMVIYILFCFKTANLTHF